MGQLCFTKLDHSVYKLEKGEEPARPCAFLSWSVRARYGVFVLFINREGKFSTTMVDRRGLWFPDTTGMPEMAFQKVFRDLSAISVPSAAFGPGPEVADVIIQALKSNDTLKELKLSENGIGAPGARIGHRRQGVRRRAQEHQRPLHLLNTFSLLALAKSQLQSLCCQ